MTAPVNVAIYYHPNAYEANGTTVMGRQSAGAGFLDAFLRYTAIETFYCRAESEAHFRQFVAKLGELGLADRQAIWIRPGELARLSTVGCLYRPDPLLAEAAWQRRFLNSRAYSLCGVTHTLCSAGVLDGLGELLLAPVYEYDAVICTSTTAKATVIQLLGQWSEYLRERLQAVPKLLPQLPVIPLGVNCDKFAPADGGCATREQLRAEWEIAADDVVVLFVGRLSYHAKANPAAMYLALEQVAKQTTKRIHLLHYGWFANDKLRDHFTSATREFCPSVRALFINDRPELYHDIWHVADIFTSLADNIQETFGLTPIEAMAAGLPQVVSDWDGYRDTVRNGIDGFRVPTLTAPPGAGFELAARFALGLDSYDRHIGHVSQCVAVDVEAATRAFLTLIDNPNLRHQMGRNARQRAREQFDWRVVIEQYQQLWQELDARRRTMTDQINDSKRGNPLSPDPFDLFQNYPTSMLAGETRLVTIPGIDLDLLGRRASHPLFSFASPLVATSEECALTVRRLGENGGMTVVELLELFPVDRRATLLRTFVWLVKMGILRAAVAQGTAAQG